MHALSNCFRSGYEAVERETPWFPLVSNILIGGLIGIEVGMRLAEKVNRSFNIVIQPRQGEELAAAALNGLLTAYRELLNIKFKKIQTAAFQIGLFGIAGTISLYFSYGLKNGCMGNTAPAEPIPEPVSYFLTKNVTHLNGSFSTPRF